MEMNSLEQTEKKKSRDFNIYYLNFSKVLTMSFLLKLKPINQVVLKHNMASHRPSQHKVQNSFWTELRPLSPQTQRKLLHHHPKLWKVWM